MAEVDVDFEPLVVSIDALEDAELRDAGLFCQDCDVS